MTEAADETRAQMALADVIDHSAGLAYRAGEYDRALKLLADARVGGSGT